MSSWYTRAELTRRVAWFYCGNALANMFGGLIAYGVLKDLSGNAGIAGWVSASKRDVGAVELQALTWIR